MPIMYVNIIPTLTYTVKATEACRALFPKPHVAVCTLERTQVVITCLFCHEYTECRATMWWSQYLVQASGIPGNHHIAFWPGIIVTNFIRNSGRAGQSSLLMTCVLGLCPLLSYLLSLITHLPEESEPLSQEKNLT